MLKSLRKAFRPAPLAAVPDGTRIYAIGDVHGRLDLLDQLMIQIDDDHTGRGGGARQLVFLGDLIDRGPDSAGVIERAMAIKRQEPETCILMGNHEKVMLKVLDGDDKAVRFFCRVGGRETILSYGIDIDRYNAADFHELADMLRAAVPDGHRLFMKAFEDILVIGDYAFVHAGIRPLVPLDQQCGSDLRWIREPFLDHSAAHAKIVVHGHTITEEVEMRQNRIGIDTGAYATGRLSALALEGSKRWIVST